MAQTGPEVADVFRRYGRSWRASNPSMLSRDQIRVMSAIQACRTEALGGHVERCKDCDHQRIAYNSCRNRHCPKCQWSAAERWLKAREAELLPVPYFHIVFTVPCQFADIAYQNKAEVYGILFKAATETLLTIAADPKHLGAKIGITSVLHTWGQNLQHHPHIHCISPAGGISAATGMPNWVPCKPGFFLPVRVLSKLFRRLFIEQLVRAFYAGKLRMYNKLANLNERSAFLDYVTPFRKVEWVVYAKRPFAGPKQVFAYLARYTHRVAITNRRIMDIKDGQVRFQWKDYRRKGKNQSQTMQLAASEFMRRFLLHALPERFHRIRHHGLFANGHRAAKLVLCRELIGAQVDDDDAVSSKNKADDIKGTVPPCPCCGGDMIIVEVLLNKPTARHMEEFVWNTYYVSLC